MTKSQVYEFEASIKPADRGGTYVAFPYDIREEFGKGRVKVHATFDGEPYDGSICVSEETPKAQARIFVRQMAV